MIVKDRYGNVDLNEGSEEESTSESEDENAQEVTKDVEIEFFKALSMLKSKNQKIYDKENTKFFENMIDNRNNINDNGIEKNSKENKPFQLKDLEREMVLKRFLFNFTLVSIRIAFLN